MHLDWLLNKSKNVDAAWLAAALDGEGSISIVKRNRKNSNYNYKCYVYIALYNTNKDFIQRALDIINNEYGEKFNIMSIKRKYYYIKITYRDVVNKIILDIYNYLIIKKHNAEICLDFLNNKLNNNIVPLSLNCKIHHGKYLGRRVLSSEEARRRALCAKNHYLKGYYGDSEAHSRAGKCKGNTL